MKVAHLKVIPFIGQGKLIISYLVFPFRNLAVLFKAFKTFRSMPPCDSLFNKIPTGRTGPTGLTVYRPITEPGLINGIRKAHLPHFLYLLFLGMHK